MVDRFRNARNLQIAFDDELIVQTKQTAVQVGWYILNNISTTRNYMALGEEYTDCALCCIILKATIPIRYKIHT